MRCFIANAVPKNASPGAGLGCRDSGEPARRLLARRGQRAGDERTDPHLAGDLDAADIQAHARQFSARQLVDLRPAALEVGPRPFGARAVLVAHVPHVGLVRADEMMVGVDAARLVAAMAQLHAVADPAVAQRPGQPVHQVQPAVQADDGIAGAVPPALPDMTARQGIDLALGREPLLDRRKSTLFTHEPDHNPGPLRSTIMVIRSS
jgi:hypothetical protein